MHHVDVTSRHQKREPKDSNHCVARLELRTVWLNGSSRERTSHVPESFSVLSSIDASKDSSDTIATSGACCLFQKSTPAVKWRRMGSIKTFHLLNRDWKQGVARDLLYG